MNYSPFNLTTLWRIKNRASIKEEQKYKNNCKGFTFHPIVSQCYFVHTFLITECNWIPFTQTAKQPLDGFAVQKVYLNGDNGSSWTQFFTCTWTKNVTWDVFYFEVKLVIDKTRLFCGLPAFRSKKNFLVIKKSYKWKNHIAHN